MEATGGIELKRGRTAQDTIMDLLSSLPNPFSVAQLKAMWPKDQKVEDTTLKTVVCKLRNGGVLELAGTLTDKRYPTYKLAEITPENIPPMELRWREWKQENGINV